MSLLILLRVKRETCKKCATWTDWIPPRLARRANLAQPYKHEDGDGFASQ